VEEIGVVRSVDGGIARVEINRSALCSRCGCCIQTGPETMELEASDAIGVSPGDRVSLEFPDYMFVKVSFAVYGFPAIVLFASLFICLEAIKLNEWQSALAAVAATAVSYFIVSKTKFARFGSDDMRPKILKQTSEQNTTLSSGQK
jgi:positive regulator of sigma E activity